MQQQSIVTVRHNHPEAGVHLLGMENGCAKLRIKQTPSSRKVTRDCITTCAAAHPENDQSRLASACLCLNSLKNSRHLQQEGEAGVAVGDMLAAAMLHVHQAHDDLAQHRQRHVDAARLLQPIARRAGLPLPLAA